MYLLHLLYWQVDFFFFKPLSYLGIGSGITIMNEHINCLHQPIPP